MSSNFQSTTLIAGALLLLILFVSAGYFQMLPAESEVGDNDAQTTLETNFQRWQENQPQTFRYVVERDCECTAEFLAPYVASEDRGARSASFNVDVESSDGQFLSEPPQALWIDDLFNSIRTALADKPVMRVDVRYEPRYGYPLELTLHTADAEQRYVIRDFEVLQRQDKTE